jgi:colicin import membrane protein
MRAGLTVSTIAHAGLILLIVVGVGMTKPLEPTPVESIAVDLISIEEFSNIRAGTLDSEIIETETPSVVEDDTPAELAQPTGNTEQDQPTPEDTPADAGADPLTPSQCRSEPIEEPVPSLFPSRRRSQNRSPSPNQCEPEPVPVEQEPALAPGQSEPAEVAPRPVVQPPFDQKRAEFKKQQEAEKKRKEEEARRNGRSKSGSRKPSARKTRRPSLPTIFLT